MTNPLICILLASIFNFLGNIFLKIHATKIQENLGLLNNYFSLFFLFSILFFLLNLFFFSQALKIINVGVAYSILVGLSIILIISTSVIFFQEKLNFINIIGMLIIILGIYLAYLKF